MCINCLPAAAWLHVTHLAVEKVPTVSLLLWQLADEEYQLLFCFWPALALGGQLGPGPAAPTLYCGWSALLGEVLSSFIRDLNYTKSRPILLFPVVSSFIGATLSFGGSHISLSSSHCYLRSQCRAFAQPRNFYCQ